MGTKSKPPVVIKSSGGGTEVPPQDGLPPFKRYIDIEGQKRNKKILTRLFFATPSDEELADTVILKKSDQFALAVSGANMPYTAHSNATTPLIQHCKSLGFTDNFATDLVRLVINHLQGKKLTNGMIVDYITALRRFVDFIATRSPMPIFLTDIDKQIWLDYMGIMEIDESANRKRNFNNARAPFKAYGPTSHGGWLASFPFRERQRPKPSLEHSSELFEAMDYSDSVMYQLLALFIYEFDRRIGYLKRYERITEADMLKDRLYHGRQAVHGNGDKLNLLREWLGDEVAGYEVLIDHYLMHHKEGLIKKQPNGKVQGGIATLISQLRGKHGANDLALVNKFLVEMARRHGYHFGAIQRSLLTCYLKKEAPTEYNVLIHQIGWCLANLVMMQTGINKEVVLTIPSIAEDGRSILTRGDGVFVSKDSTETEVHLYGNKAKVGNAPSKIIPIIIVKESPLYKMLVAYERYVKVAQDGPFFEFDESFIARWPKAGRKDFEKHYPVTDENGKQLSSIDTKRFRKVFASGQLLDRMKNINDMNDLAEMLRNDLNHEDFDTTLTNYLLKSSGARSVIDIAIATITGGKLNDLKCKSQIEVRKPIPFKKKVFLCYCADPHNPSHDVAIADECRHYDLCLGCERSIITKEHLPYICLRIIQYEAEREKDPYIWTGTFEDRWCIAHDALAHYMEKDKKNGRNLVDEAWAAAREERITLPPIIAATRK